MLNRFKTAARRLADLFPSAQVGEIDPLQPIWYPPYMLKVFQEEARRALPRERIVEPDFYGGLAGLVFESATRSERLRATPSPPKESSPR